MNDAGHTRAEREQALLRDDINRLQDWGAQHPEIFGGLWLDTDPADRGTGPATVGLATTAEPDLVRAELAPLLRHPDRLLVVHHRWTLRELRQLRDDIAREKGGVLPGGATPIATAGIDVAAGVVDVGLSGHDRRFADEITERYGADRVRIAFGVRVSPADGDCR